MITPHTVCHSLFDPELCCNTNQTANQQINEHARKQMNASNHHNTCTVICSNYYQKVLLLLAYGTDQLHKTYTLVWSCILNCQMSSQFSRLVFYKVRLGTYFLKELQYRSDNLEAGPFLVLYWPLPAIMNELGHTNNNLHYLKLDIEGSEWNVLEESVFTVGQTSWFLRVTRRWFKHNTNNTALCKRAIFGLTHFRA